MISDIFATITTISETAFLQRDSGRVSGRHAKSAAESFLATVDTSENNSLSAAVILAIHQLAQDLPLQQSYKAYQALLGIAASISTPLSEVNPGRIPTAAKEELDRIRPGISPPISTSAAPTPAHLQDPALLDAATSSNEWICRISVLLCDLLFSILHHGIFLAAKRLVSSETEAAKVLLPVLLLRFTVENGETTAASPTKGKRRAAARISDEQPVSLQSCRSAVAKHFEQVLESHSADPLCSEIIVHALLSLRRFRPVHEEPDKVCYWYEVDTNLLAKRCIACGLYTASIFFVEHGVWEQDEFEPPPESLARNRANLLHQAYMNMDDLDAFYGITDGDVRDLLLRRLQHEGQWLRAFQYHAADYEAASSDGQSARNNASSALGQSLSLLGFPHLVEDLGSRSDSSTHNHAAIAGTSSWNTSAWDLPGSSSANLGPASDLNTVLQILRQASSEQDVDAPLSNAIHYQLQSLCSIPAESIQAMRRMQGDLLSLGQVKDWRKASATLGAEEAVVHLRALWTRSDAVNHFELTERVLNTRQSVLEAVRQRMQSSQIGDVLDGAAEQVARVERSLLVSLSRQAREHEKLQKAINATARAERIESALGDGANVAREEFAAVLWDQNEHSPAIQLLSQIVDGLNVSAQSGVPQKRRKARLLSLLAQWRATARSQHPREIDRLLFEPALTLVASSSASQTTDPTADLERSDIAYRWARFAEDNYRGADVAEINRLRLYIDRRHEEIAQNQRQFERSSSKTERSKLHQFQRQAEKILRQDQARLTELEASRTHFLHRSVAMYARALASADTHDDAIARLISLWFESAEDVELNRLLESCLTQIPSHKFVILMHQLSARLTELPSPSPNSNSGSNSISSSVSSSFSISDVIDKMAPFQSNLARLLLRMCLDHPFHCLYAIFALIKTGADAKMHSRKTGPRHSSSSSDSAALAASPQVLRSKAAEKIWKHVKTRSSLGKRIRTFEELCLAYVEWAEYNLTEHADRYFQSSGAIKKGALRMPPSTELRLSKMRNLDVPVATARLEIDPTLQYETFVSITRYSDTFTTAGGIHLPKISECIGSDGKRYKQLFKRDDDLRQDAVMQQVFRIVNDLLGADRRTRERHLTIRTYTVLPSDRNAACSSLWSTRCRLAKCYLHYMTGIGQVT